MKRKVFLSFLGISLYEPTLYIANGQDEDSIEPTRFIQEATIKEFCRDFASSDKIFVFTTKGALQNWEDNDHFNTKTKESVFYEGLNSCLKRLNLKCDVQNIPISDGKTTDEIWGIFQVIFNLINENDELIFDITHGFRSLPMLNMVLINYAKLLKKISVAGIYYGNYEARSDKNGKSFSPIWDLKDFVRLQEWTNSAQMFLTAGYSDDLVRMMLETGISQSKSIDSFSKDILTNRCISIIDGTNSISVKNLLANEQEPSMHPAIKPIFTLVEKQFEHYQPNEVLNAIPAIEWCINHNLIQQGYTIMSEFLPTYALNYIKEDFKNKDLRNSTNGFMAIEGKIEKFNFREDIRTIQEELLKKLLGIPFFKDLCKRNKSTNAENRDDINHGGFRKTPKDYESFKNDLQDKLIKLKDVINKIENSK